MKTLILDAQHFRHYFRRAASILSKSLLAHKTLHIHCRLTINILLIIALLALDFQKLSCNINHLYYDFLLQHKLSQAIKKLKNYINGISNSYAFLISNFFARRAVLPWFFFPHSLHLYLSIILCDVFAPNLDPCSIFG